MKKEWQTKMLGEVCVLDKRQGLHKHLPYVGLEHIESQTGRFLGSAEPLEVRSSTFRFTPENVLYGRLRPYLNKVMLPDFGGHCSTEIFPIRPLPELSREFLHYWFLTETTVEQISATSTGTRMPRANMNTVLTFPFSFPPLPEQQRIVAILDEAFEGIATARANAEKNLGNARAIFENQRDIVFESLREDWEAQPLGKLAAFRNGINYTKGSKGECIRILGVKDFRASFDAPVDNLETVVIDGELSEQDALQTGDIVVVRSNGNVELIGRSLLVGELPAKTSHSGFTIRVRLTQEGLIPKYLCHFMKSSAERRRLIEGGIGTNIKSLNQGMLSSLTVPLPPMEAQSVVVERLDCLCLETMQLESVYQRKLTALDNLKQSLLHHAFSGQL